MTPVPRSVLETFLWRPALPHQPTAAMPRDPLDPWRPVEVPAGRPSAGRPLELPELLQGSPLDRGGLSTWLTTRRAEAEQARQDRAAEYRPANACSRAGAVQAALLRAGGETRGPAGAGGPVDLGEGVRRGLLAAWAGPEGRVEEVPSRTCAAMEVERWVERTPCGAQPGIYANIHSSLQQGAWLAGGQGTAEERREESAFGERPSRNEALRSSLLAAWSGVEAAELEPAATTAAAEEPASRAEALRRSLLSAWSSSGQESLAEAMGGLGLASSGQDQEDSASEASIVTLDTVTDISEDFDDFSDMQHELCQWISK